jgi:hypothetical protein
MAVLKKEWDPQKNIYIFKNKIETDVPNKKKLIGPINSVLQT